MPSNRIIRICFLASIALITALSFAPFAVKSQLTMGPKHDMGHFFLFMLASLMGCLIVSGVNGRLLCCIGLAVMAMTLEWFEKVMSPHNPYEWHDVRVDSLGILAGCFVVILLPTRTSRASR